MADLPRLLVCTFDVIPAPTGSSRRVTEYLKGLSDRFQVVVLSAKTPDHSHIEKYQGARLLRVPVGTGDLASRLQAFDRAVRRQLDSEEYSLVHFTDPFGGYALCELKPTYGYQLLYEAQGFPSQELRYTHPQTEGDRRFLAKLRREELYCLMNADQVVTGSGVSASFIRGLGVPESQIRILPAPVDLEPYVPHLLGEPNGAPMRLLYLGSQVGWQGLPTLLRGLQHALRQTDVRLTVVGPRHPDWQPRLDDLVNELKLSGKVEFQPPVPHDDLFKVLATCDVGALPLDDVERNRVQGGPMAKVSEYLAAGRPVIAADLPIARQAIPEGAGAFYPPGDATGLGQRLIELAAHPEQRIAMGRKARADALARLDASSIRGRLIDLYDEMLGRTAGKAKPAEPFVASEELEAPVVVGEALAPDDARAQATTEPDARPNEAPVVLGLPLRDEADSPFTPSGVSPTSGSDPSVPIVRGTELEPLASPPPSAIPRFGEGERPTSVPMLPVAAQRPEVSQTEREVPVVQAPADDPPEISSDEVIEAPEPSKLDPWFAQIAHGYCPPEGQAFARPVPPTNFPGRDELPKRPSRPRLTRTDDSSPGFKP